MRKVLTLVMSVGTVGTLMAQTPTPTVRDGGLLSVVGLEYKAMQRDAAGTTRMSGGLVIVFRDGTRLTADTGTMSADGQTIDLSGSVKLTSPMPTTTR